MIAVIVLIASLHKTRRCPGDRASEQVLSLIPVAIWGSEVQQFDKPFRTVHGSQGGVLKPPEVLKGFQWAVHAH